MKFSAQQIATLVQGIVVGDEKVMVGNVAKIEESKAGDLCFLANPKYESYVYTAKASIILVNESFEQKQPVSATLIKVKDAYAAFAILLKTYESITAGKPKSGIEEPTVMAASAQVANNAYIGAFSYVGENVVIGENTQIYPQVFIGDQVKIGKHVIIYPGVKIYKNCVIGDYAIIHAGCVIGSDGFGFALQNGAFEKIPQIGHVIIEDHVEIGANTTIDRATMGATIIKRGAKLDNLIQIAHNVEIGQSTVIASQAGVSGSTKIGDYCMIGGQAGIVGHIKIASQTKINAQSGVAKEIKQVGTSLTGSPAFDYKSALKSQVVYKQLPELLQRIQQLEKKIESIQNNK